MWELKKNYPREEQDTKCPICNQNKDTTEHALKCETAETVYTEKILILETMKILKEHITEKYKEDRSKRINCIAQEQDKMLTMEVKYGKIIEDLKRKSRHHIP